MTTARMAVRRVSAGLAAGLLALLLSTATAAPVTARDDLGRDVTLPRPAQRIVTLAPHATELVFAAGAGDRVVGTVAHSDYPPAARALPRVGDAHRIDRERLLALAPDLVVLWGSGTPPGERKALAALDIPVFVSEPADLGAVADSLSALGRLAGTPAAGAAAGTRFRERLARLRAGHAGAAPLRVFYQVSARPLVTVGGRHLVTQVLALCGGRNVFDDLPEPAPRVGLEAVVARDPQVILYGAPPLDDTATEDHWRQWPAIAAVAARNLYAAPADLLHRPGPRILDGAERVCGILQRARADLENKE